MLGDDRQIELKPTGNRDGNWVTAQVTLDKDGLYHIAAIDRGENVRLSEDFFIEARKDSPPTVKIDRPGRDAKVNPIEEVTITVNADDDFALNEVALHYSVNGGAEKTVQLLPQKGVKTASGKYVLRSKITSSRPAIWSASMPKPRTRAIPPRPISTSSRRSLSNAITRRRSPAEVAAAWAAATTISRSRSARRTSSPPPGTSTRTVPRTRRSRPTTPSFWPNRKRS